MTRISLPVCALIFFSTICTNVVSGQSPLRPRNGFIVDTTSTISASDARHINDTCSKVASRTSGEILVCEIPSTNGRNARRFATDLFNRWEIGDKSADNGLLIFVAMKDRKAEIVLGDGIDSVREETMARSVMSDYMMPKFKQGKPSKGIRIAVDQCAKLFFDANQASGTANLNSAAADPHIEIAAETNNDFLDPEVVPRSREPKTQATATQAKVANPIVRPAAQPNRGNGAGFGGTWLAILTGGLTMGGAGLGIHRLMTNRRRPRNCEQCGQPMMLLDEAQDDEHLDAGERLEEKLGSVDYDVWVCTNCVNALKLRYGKFFTSYSQCPGCRSKTSSSTSRTVRAASTLMSGLREVETTCAHCSYHDITQHTIPIITHSSSSSNFSSGGGSSFGGGGGGSSSGGGASGSW